MKKRLIRFLTENHTGDKSCPVKPKHKCEGGDVKKSFEDALKANRRRRA